MSAPIQTSDESQVLLHQLKGSFTSIYLTVLSIVQGVTLTTLATVVATTIRDSPRCSGRSSY